MARFPTPAEERGQAGSTTGAGHLCLGQLSAEVRRRHPWLAALDIREVFTPNGTDLLDVQIICPAHNDHRPSCHLTIGGDGNFKIYCASGCPQEAVLEALDAQPSGSRGAGAFPAFDGSPEAVELRHQALLREPRRLAELHRLGFSIEAVRSMLVGYVHLDPEDWILARRMAPELRHRLAFSMRLYGVTADVGASLVVPPQLRIQGQETVRAWGRQGISGGLDRLDPSRGPVWVFEGPRTALAGRELGLQAIGLPHLNFKISRDLKTYFRRFEKAGAVVVGDAGGKGTAAAERWALDLRSVVQDVRHLVINDVPDGDDIADVLADEGAGEAKALLDDLLRRSAPIKPRRSGPRAEKTDRAERWLRERLTNSPRPAAEVKRDFLDQKIGSEATLRRAKAKDHANVRSFRERIPGPWSWVIDGEESP